MSVSTGQCEGKTRIHGVREEDDEVRGRMKIPRWGWLESSQGVEGFGVGAFVVLLAVVTGFHG